MVMAWHSLPGCPILVEDYEMIFDAIFCHMMITLYMVDVPRVLLYQWLFCTWQHDVILG